MSSLKTLLAQYTQLGLDSTIIQYMYNSSNEEDRIRLITDENFFFDKYSQFQ